MKAAFSAISFLFLCTFAHAQTISLAEAKAKASMLHHGKAKVEGPATRAMSSLEEEELELALRKDVSGHTLYYIFNYPDGGFAIIGGNAVAREVLGYSENGSFDEDNIPEGLQDMLLAYQEQITAAIEQGISAGSAMRAKKLTRTDIAPLIETQWSQNSPYNWAIPRAESYTSRFVAGCNATAAGQIMYYYRYPEHGTGSHSYQRTYEDIETITFEADFGATTYDWEKIKPTYKSVETTEEEKMAAAILNYHLGVAMDMEYGTGAQGGSSSLITAAGKALTQNFGYDKSATLEHRIYYSDEQWEEIIYDELSAGHPILYTGQDINGQGGHAFVCHGYDADLDGYYFNWGWGGKYDGIFPLTGAQVLAPDPEGASSDMAGIAFSSHQTAYIGLVPDNGTPEYTPQVALSKQFTFKDGSTKLTIDRENPDTDITLEFQNLKTTNVGYMPLPKLTYGVILEDTDTGRPYSASTAWPTSFSSQLAPCAGTYRIYPAFKVSADEPWHKMLIQTQFTIPTLTIVNGFGDYNHDGRVTVADIPAMTEQEKEENINKMTDLLLQKE